MFFPRQLGGGGGGVGTELTASLADGRKRGGPNGGSMTSGPNSRRMEAHKLEPYLLLMWATMR